MEVTDGSQPSDDSSILSGTTMLPSSKRLGYDPFKVEMQGSTPAGSVINIIVYKKKEAEIWHCFRILKVSCRYKVTT